jgi:hypothetical protein
MTGSRCTVGACTARGYTSHTTGTPARFPTGGDAERDRRSRRSYRWPTPDWEWHSAAEDTPDQSMALWQAAVARSRSTLAEALDDGGLDQLAHYTTSTGESPSLRRIMIDPIEAYARLVGHADLIRESVDGLVGEDPPR